MNINRLVQRFQRIIELGPAQTTHLLKNRINQGFFKRHWRNKALKKSAAHSWQQITARHGVTWQLWRQRQWLESLDELTHDSSWVIEQAERYTQGIINILGSGDVQYTTMPWHLDFRLHAQDPNADCAFDATLFYADIVIAAGQTEQLSKDIKVPWELSRCHHLPILGHAYALTKDARYAKKFEQTVRDWITHNPYLLGTNWVCPMEVGIRAINWIYAWHFFKDTTALDEQFWHDFSSTLYDHAHYLQNNWEFYDGRTSNHYLSDLVGYFYLCWFFQHMPSFTAQARWCFYEILREWDKEVFDEGTDYEGSTQYHRLVTELFTHAVRLSNAFGFKLPERYAQKLQRMMRFIDWCTPQGGTLISIGDHDSGHVLAYDLIPHMTTAHDTQPLKHFAQFGLTVLKTPAVHCTLRHQAYHKDQPSGHYHNDALSVTVAVNGVPIFVDPASYVYTPSKIWRNRFRSASVHNSFYITHQEPTPFDERLFALAMPPHKNRCDNNPLHSTHNFYAHWGLQAERTVAYHDTECMLMLTDRWHVTADNTPSFESSWNFTLQPTIDAEKIDQTIVLRHQNDVIATVQSNDLDFSINQTWVSESYGSKTPSTCLQARAYIDKHNNQPIFSTCIRLLPKK